MLTYDSRPAARSYWADPLGIWAVMDSVASGVNVLMKGPAVVDGVTLTDRPYVVQFSSGSGRVTYTSFHNEAQTTADMDVVLEQLLFTL